MAARLNPIVRKELRERIRTTQILKRLEANALGELEAELTMGRIRSIEIMLKKALTDLNAVEHTGDVVTSYVLRAPLPAAAADEWQTENAPTIQ